MAPWFLSCLSLSFGIGFIVMIGEVAVHPHPSSAFFSSFSSSLSSSSSSSSSSFVVAALRMLPPTTTRLRARSSAATAATRTITTPIATGLLQWHLQLQRGGNDSSKTNKGNNDNNKQKFLGRKQPRGDNDSRQNNTNNKVEKKMPGRTTESYRALALVGMGILPLFVDDAVLPVPSALITDAFLLLAVGSLFVGNGGDDRNDTY